MALAVSFALSLSTCVLAFASVSKSAAGNSPAPQKQGNPWQVELQLTIATASASRAGVMVHWTTNGAPDNLGFNVYRVTSGLRVRVNPEIIPGAVFASTRPDLMRGGSSYSWFDAAGNENSTYVIEAVSVAGTAKSLTAIHPVFSKSDGALEQTPDALDTKSGTTESANTFERYYPAADSSQSNIVNGALEDQWSIAGQSALKIGIKKDGWYRVTQPQMVAAGFNPTVDIRNLRLFIDGNETAISTNQFSGPFGPGDYIEFYGRGLDTPTTDTRIYYLIAGTTPGKRVGGELQLDSPILPGPTSTPLPTGPLSAGPKADGPILRDPIFFSPSLATLSVWSDSLNSSTSNANQPKDKETQPHRNSPTLYERRELTPEAIGAGENPILNATVVSSKTANENAADRQRVAKDTARQSVFTSGKASGAAISRSLKAAKSSAPLGPKAQSRKPVSKKKKAGKSRRKQRRHHAMAVDGFVPANFDSTIAIKDRVVYIANIMNADEENWFGRVVAATPVNHTLTISNLDTAAAQPATLEFALQGIMSQFASPHQVNVTINGHDVTGVSFAAIEHAVRSVSIPIAQLQNGANTLTFTKTSTGEVCAVDYIRLTYPHKFNADSGSLRFNLRGTQTLNVDGFATSLVRLIDYTNPLAVKIMFPPSEATASGYAITVPESEPVSKDQRLFLAIPESQFDQPASLSLNQPSTLNLNSNNGDFLIVSHKNFIPNLSANVSPINTSLVAQRAAQGFSVLVADIEDVYDEFGYGVHGPQAIRTFLQHAAAHWAKPPRYIAFAGDASLDPRNYMASPNGSVDFVPTKLVDATFNETCSDDWLTDFNDDGIADIPVGRLPVRNAADADLIISKIVNFAPVTPESAMLVADDPTGYYFNFEEANDDVESLLPDSMAVQRVNVRTEASPAQAKANVIAGFNQGRALVNYSGHGNVDVWASSSIFTATDASTLTNGSSLSFVVVMDCLNGYFHDPNLLSLSEALLKSPNGGAVAGFASSGLTFPDGQHEMSQRLYSLIYGVTPIRLGDAIKDAKEHTNDIDVRRTWIYFGDPSLKIR